MGRKKEMKRLAKMLDQNQPLDLNDVLNNLDQPFWFPGNTITTKDFFEMMGPNWPKQYDKNWFLSVNDPFGDSKRMVGIIEDVIGEGYTFRVRRANHQILIFVGDSESWVIEENLDQIREELRMFYSELDCIDILPYDQEF